MKLSEEGIKHIQAEEALRTEAYQDERGIWTIGYGHTGPEVKPGSKITVEQADEYFRKDVEHFENAVQSSVTAELTQQQFDSLVSFTYNVGEGNLKKSTLLKKLNSGDSKGAGEEFDKWVRAGDHVSKGLVSRRDREKRIFMGENAYKSSRLADTGSGGGNQAGNSSTISEDQLLNQDKEALAQMEILRRKLGATEVDPEYLEKLRKEGSGLG
jgi:lysozyme